MLNEAPIRALRSGGLSRICTSDFRRARSRRRMRTRAQHRTPPACPAAERVYEPRRLRYACPSERPLSKRHSARLRSGLAQALAEHGREGRGRRGETMLMRFGYFALPLAAGQAWTHAWT